MSEMSMVETLRIWNDGVSLMEKGNFEDALMNFMTLEGRTDASQQLITSGRNLFNIGQTYHALGRLDMAAKAFEEAVEKDKMMAVAHFMLGNVNLALNRNEMALKNYDDAYFYLRGNKLINYQQLGLKFKLYMCEILANRAIAHSRLSHDQDARNDFLESLQSKVEPRHSIIEDALLCWQSGQSVEPIQLPSHAVYQPQKKHLLAIKERPDYLGKSKVVAANEHTAKLPEVKPKSPTSPKEEEEEFESSIPEEHLPEAKNMVTGRQALLTDLRKKETRKSLKKVSKPAEPPNKPLPGLPDRPASPRRPPPSPRSQSPRQTQAPVSRRFLSNEDVVNGTDKSRTRSGVEISRPPSKPLPPPPRSKSPLPGAASPNHFSRGHDVTVTLQLVLTRSVKVGSAASTGDLVRAAASTFKIPEDSIGIWHTKNNQLTALEEHDLQDVLNSPPDNKPTIYCYEK